MNETATICTCATAEDRLDYPHADTCALMGPALCGATAPCRNEAGHPGQHWHPDFHGATLAASSAHPAPRTVLFEDGDCGDGDCRYFGVYHFHPADDIPAQRALPGRACCGSTTGLHADSCRYKAQEFAGPVSRRRDPVETLLDAVDDALAEHALAVSVQNRLREAKEAFEASGREEYRGLLLDFIEYGGVKEPNALDDAARQQDEDGRPGGPIPDEDGGL